MKKLLTMIMILSVLLVAAGCGKTAALTVLDASGKPVENTAYLQIAEQEAVQILTETYNCSQEDAKNRLATKGYTLYTSYRPDMYAALKTACAEQAAELDSGCAVTDLEGNLLAVYSSSEEINYAAVPTSPYSAFKPLSVYAQALEKGLINWVSTYEDSPVKQVQNENGQLRDWPSNSGGSYSHEQVTVYQALQKSLNTVAVKCLQELGVMKSIDFLQQSFGIDLAEEEYTASLYGEEEVLGNVALGYLTAGVTPVDMAGCYQIFANGGTYTAPGAVQKISDKKGTVLYENSKPATQVISAVTADIMNKLLQGVVSGGGTGEAAAVKGLQVAGKTGTGDQNMGNWFVGITPAYSVAIWHGAAPDNCAPEIFSRAVTELYVSQPQQAGSFASHANLQELIYCTESNMTVCPQCTRIDLGYFPQDQIPDICTIHN